VGLTFAPPNCTVPEQINLDKPEWAVVDWFCRLINNLTASSLCIFEHSLASFHRTADVTGKPFHGFELMNQKSLAKAYKWALIGAGLLVCFLAIRNLKTAELDQRFLFLALITIACGSRITIRIPRVKGLISVSDTFIFLAVLLFGTNAAVLLAAAEGLCSSVRFSRKFTTVMFNAGVMACATFLAATASITVLGSRPSTDRLGDFVAALTLLAFVQYLINSGIVSVGAALMTNQPLWITWKEGFLWTSLTYFAGASAAGVAFKLIELVGFYAVLATAPVIAVVYFTYCTYLKNIEASRAQAEQAERHMFALRQSEERFRSAFDHAAGMALVGPDGKWIEVNRSLSEILGYSEQELLGMDFQSLTYHTDLSSVLEQLKHLKSGATNGLQMEKRFLHKNGDVIWVLLSVTGVNHSGHEPNFIFQIQDITDRKRAEERLVHDAFHDGLTGLPNRVLFMDHLKQSLGRARGRKHLPFAVLFLDFDRFKLVNDSLGHMVGDQLLIAIAGRLKANVRPGDTVARLGGDEFTILLEDLNQSDEVAIVAARLLKSLSMPFNLAGREVFTTASIGIAHSTMGYHYAEDMLRDADIAMYRAKTLGKARFEVFDPSMHANAVNLLRIETDLWRAIERDELYLEYQPIVSLETGKIAGFEALLRWRHPSLGVVPPSEFIAVAEETGLIVPIGTWILEEAARQVRRWQGREKVNAKLFISVNLSAKQFMKADFAADVQRIISTMEIDPGCIKLEITESMVMNKVESTIATLTQLQEIGVETSIDDFGTGYSSLSYLPRFPISTLKVDRSFVNSITENSENLEIVRTIVMLAHNLKMKVIAEGVESTEQLAQLRRMKCEFAQGFFFSRPLSGEESTALVEADNVYPMMSLERFIEYAESAIA
jgi:diguanylate cyclase (GGDEF)-like protein/PAS domain S-box-containing protein